MGDYSCADGPLLNHIKGGDGVHGTLVTEDMIVQAFKGSNDYMCHTYRELRMNGCGYDGKLITVKKPRKSANRIQGDYELVSLSQ